MGRATGIPGQERMIPSAGFESRHDGQEHE
jgi:hypothetical protein